MYRVLFIILMTCGGCTQGGGDAESNTAAAVTHDLIGTRWAVMQLGSGKVELADNERELFIVLEQSLPRIVGFAGCNRLMGSYTLESDVLTFSSVATTRMACPQMQRETAFLNALKAVQCWKIRGASLELYDVSGMPVAMLEARDL